MTQMKNVTLDELFGLSNNKKPKGNILSFSARLETEDSKIQNGSCPQMNYHLLGGNRLAHH